MQPQQQTSVWSDFGFGPCLFELVLIFVYWLEVCWWFLSFWLCFCLLWSVVSFCCFLLTWEWQHLQVWWAHWSVSCTHASLGNFFSCSPRRCSPSLSRNGNPTMGDGAGTQEGGGGKGGDLFCVKKPQKIKNIQTKLKPMFRLCLHQIMTG